MIIAQIIVISVWIARIFVHAVKEGEPVPPTKFSTLRTIVNVAIDAAILYYGGFFDCLLGRLP